MSSVDLFASCARQTGTNRDKFSINNADVLLASHEQIEITHDKNDEIRMTNDELNPNDEV
jgi:hypothetical protein